MTKKLPPLFVPLIIVAFLLLIAVFWAQSIVTSAQADAPQPVPAFQGEPYTFTLKNPESLNQTPVILDEALADPTVVFSDTFESGLDGAQWTSLDDSNSDGGEYKWDSRMHSPAGASGQVVVWAIGGGLDGSTLNPAADAYPNNIDTQLILGPLSLQNVLNPSLEFSYWLESDTEDKFGVAISDDGVTYDGWELGGGTGTILSNSQSLSAYAGKTTIYIAFTFTSDASGPSGKSGVFIDDVTISGGPQNSNYLPIIRNDPTPTPIPPTPTPVSQTYEDEFTDSNTNWAMRRTDVDDNAKYEVRYDTAKGELEVDIKSANDYLLVSPLAVGPAAPFSMEVRADFTGNLFDEHSYGLVFGGDKGSGSCPANSNSGDCFNTFYWLHVRYRENSNSPKLEMQLKRVTSFNSDNEPLVEVIWGWINPDDVGGVSINAEDWTTFRLEIEDDNKLDIFANGARVAKVDVADLLTHVDGNPYFGLIMEVKDQGDMTAQFDFVKLEPLGSTRGIEE